MINCTLFLNHDAKCVYQDTMIISYCIKIMCHTFHVCIEQHLLIEQTSQELVTVQTAFLLPSEPESSSQGHLPYSIDG